MQSYLLILVRIASFMVTAPVFSIRTTPTYLKIGLSTIIAFLLFPVVGQGQLIPQGMGNFIYMVILEVVVGLALGFAAALAFTAIRVAGELIDLHVGFSMASLLDPHTGSGTTLVGRFLYILAILLFLALDGHHSLLLALGGSFDLIPLGGAVLNKEIATEVISFFTSMFLLGFKIAAPFMAVVILTDISLSLVSRTVPQINVFIMGFPLKAGLGIFVLIIIMPLFLAAVNGIISQMEQDLMIIIRGFM
ncbi:MAG: flagellar type III secretion system protein FliR [Clostridia bacterium]|nr:flagellar type III secretion system protein FliR [Clostridia bacterium]